jgi:nitrogen fixation NifU-like protein
MELDDLYQEVILDHKRRPRNFGPLPDATRHVEGFNPLCGDHIHLHVKLEGDVIDDIRFEGEGCAISTASASLMTEALKGKPVRDAEALYQAVHALLTEEGFVADVSKLGKLSIFSGVRNFPSRVKCASLAWHSLAAAIEEGGDDVITTE